VRPTWSLTSPCASRGAWPTSSLPPALVRVLASDDVRALVQRTARFNWHRDLIVTLVRHPGVAALLFRTLFR